MRGPSDRQEWMTRVMLELLHLCAIELTDAFLRPCAHSAALLQYSGMRRGWRTACLGAALKQWGGTACIPRPVATNSQI